jgi:glycine oxidase
MSILTYGLQYVNTGRVKPSQFLVGESKKDTGKASSIFSWLIEVSEDGHECLVFVVLSDPFTDLEGYTGMQQQHHRIIQRTAKPIGQTTFDVIVIGGGIIGCSIALALTEHKYRVAVVERHALGSEASTAAIGGLTPQSDEFTRGPLRQFALSSVKEYPDWLAHLEDLTGIRVDFHKEGQLEVAFSEQEVQDLEERLHTWESEKFDVRRLSAEEVRRLEPLINPEVLAGCHLQGEPHLDPMVLMNAIAAALNYSGCTIIEWHKVIKVICSNGRATGVKLVDGTVLSSEWVVLAAGA